MSKPALCPPLPAHVLPRRWAQWSLALAVILGMLDSPQASWWQGTDPRLFTLPYPQVPHQSAVLASTAGSLHEDAKARSRSTSFLQATPQNEEPGTARGAADWPPRIDIPPHPKNLGTTLSFGGGKRKCVCATSQISCTQNHGSQGPGWWYPSPQFWVAPRALQPLLPTHLVFMCF